MSKHVALDWYFPIWNSRSFLILINWCWDNQLAHTIKTTSTQPFNFEGGGGGAGGLCIKFSRPAKYFTGSPHEAFLYSKSDISLRKLISLSKKCFFTNKTALLWHYISHYKTAFCFLKLRCTNKYIEFPSENRVLARCMSRMITFEIALSCCAARERSENFKMKNSCPQWDSISGPLARQTDALSITPRGRLNVTIHRRTISLLISIYIAPRADVDRWNQIDCFIMYRNVIQYIWPFCYWPWL